MSCFYKKYFLRAFIFSVRFLLLGFLLCAYNVQDNILYAGNTVRLTDESSLFELQEKLWYFVPSKEMSYTEVLQNDSFFSPLREKKFLGYHEKSIWVRVRVNNLSQQKDWILYANQPQLDQFEFFNASDNLSFITGDKIKFSASDTFGRFPYFPIHIKKNTTVLFYFRLQTSNNFFVDLRMQKPAKFYDYTNKSSFFHGFHLGTLFLLSVISLFLFFLSHKKKYLLYFFFLFSLTSVFFIFNGFAHYFFAIPFVSNTLLSVLILISCSLFIIFLLDALLLQKYAPFTHSFFFLLALLIFFFAFFSPFLSYAKVDFLSLILFTGIAIFSLFAVLRYGKKNHSEGIAFLFSYLFLTVGMLLRVIFSRGMFNDGFFLENFSEWLSIVGAFFFLFSLLLQDKKVRQKNEDNRAIYLDTLLTQKNEQEKLLSSYKEQTENEEKISRSLYRGIFAADFQREPHVEIEPFFLSVAAPSGDFYQIHQLAPNRYRFFVADTVGSGTSAVLASLAVKTEYRLVKNSQESLDVLMQKMNKNFMEKFSHLHVFFTCFLMDIDLEKNTISYVSAGHPDQIFLQEKQASLLKHSGRLMGFSQNLSYQVQSEVIQSKTRIYLFTKGVVEEENKEGKPYGAQRLYQKLYQLFPKSLKESVHLVVEDTKEFKAYKNFSCDITIIGIEIHPQNVTQEARLSLENS